MNLDKYKRNDDTERVMREFAKELPARGMVPPSKLHVIGMANEIILLRNIVATNCDPTDATPVDAEVIRAAHKFTFPENYTDEPRPTAG